MSKDMRKNMLLKAWPEMPERHRPDIVAWTAEPQDRLVQHTSAFLWPHINLEDLCKPKWFLLMLNSRAETAPQNFIYCDLEPTTFAYRIGLIQELVLPPQYYMAFDDSQPEAYGCISSPADSCRTNLTPGEGLWVLEIQSRLYGFLSTCCFMIQSIAPLITQPIPPSVITISNLGDGVEYLSCVSYAAPYMAPGKGNLRHLINIVRSMKDSSTDHLNNLRADPAYFAMFYEEVRDHQVEWLLDTNNQQHPIFVNNDVSSLFAGRILKDLVHETFQVHNYLGILYSRLSQLQDAISKNPVTNSNMEGLPYEESIYALEHDVLRILQAFLHGSYLARSFFASPPMRPYTRRRVPKPGEDSSSGLERQPGIPRSETLEWLDYYINCLSSDNQGRFIMGRKTLIIELEALLTKDPDARFFISTRVARQLSLVSILCECLHLTGRFQPWIRTSRCRAKDAKKYEDDFNRNYERQYNLTKNVKPTFWCALSKRFMCEIYEYPANQPRSKETIDKMRKAEAYLDKFWKALIGRLRHADENALPQELVKPIAAQQTKPWVMSKPPSEAADKMKTAQVPEDLVLQNIEAKTEIKEEEVKKELLFNYKVARLLKALFSDEPNPSQTPNIIWEEFVFILQTLGFKAEKLFGSGWCFTMPDPSKDELSWKSIHFDEPYMMDEMPHMMVKYYGKRIRQRFA